MAVTVTLRLTTMNEAEDLIDALYAGAGALENASQFDGREQAESLRKLAEDICNVTP
jgi:hypothetical protein